LQARVAEPEPTRLFGEIGPHPTPMGMVSFSAIAPLNPLTARIVTVVVEVAPAKVTGETDVIVKSWNLMVTVAL
jgi:hypothetical protein